MSFTRSPASPPNTHAQAANHTQAATQMQPLQSLNDTDIPSKSSDKNKPSPTSATRHLPVGWEKLAGFDWQPSSLCEQMYGTQIAIDEDISLCVEAGGNPNNPAIVMVLGLGSQLIFWPNEFIKQLIAAGFFVVRFDHRDMGLSTKIDSDNNEALNVMKMMMRLQVGLSNRHHKVAYQLTDLADDTAKLIECLDIAPAHLIGASMGGMVAQITAARYPHLIARLGLLFTTNNHPFLPIPKPRQLYTLFKKPDSPSQADVIRHSQWFLDVVGSPGHIDQRQVSQLATLRYQRNYRPKGTVQQLHAILATGSIAAYSRQVSAPTLVLHGSEDGLLPSAHGRKVASDIANATFELIDGMGHDLPAYYIPFIVKRLKRHFQPT